MSSPMRAGSLRQSRGGATKRRLLSASGGDELSENRLGIANESSPVLVNRPSSGVQNLSGVGESSAPRSPYAHMHYIL